MKPRKLTAAEVTFTTRIEQDDIPVRGNAMASGDAALDKQVEDQILAELDAGNVEAWCSITVKATWKGFEGTDHMGACSHLPGDDQPSIERQVEATIADHDMRGSALDDLNREIEAACGKLAPLLGDSQ